MKRTLLIAEFMSQPWSLMPERLAAFSAILARWHAGQEPSAEDRAKVAADKEKRQGRPALPPIQGGIAVLPLYGVITQRGNMTDDISGPGSVSTEKFSQALRSAVNDPAVGGVIIDIDSPGGSVYGISELADEIYQARRTKPVVAIANSLAASAAYWIGSAASEFYVTPGGEVGSIGVWMAHQDLSAMYDAAGIKTTLVSAGKYKTEGNVFQPLDKDAKAFLQTRVDDYYNAFVKAVARGRNTDMAKVRNGMGQGRILGAADAKAAGMVDDVDTLDGVINRMGKQLRKTGGAKRANAATAHYGRLLRLIQGG